MHEADIDVSDEGKIYVTFTDAEFRKWTQRYSEQEKLFTRLDDGNWVADAQECIKHHRRQTHLEK